MEQTFFNAKQNKYRISFRKIARAAAAEVHVHKKLAIITLVLYGVAMLLFIFDSDISSYYDNGDTFYPSGWGIFFAVVGVIVGYFTALNVFRDMNNQQLCDVSMALPIKASERFLSKILSLFYIQVFPLIVSTLCGNGLAVLTGSMNHGSLSDETADTVFAVVFACLAASMFIMAIAVLCACCCGAMAESAYFSLILMFVINGLPMGFIRNIVERCSGYDGWSFFSLPQSIDVGYWGFLYLLSSKSNGDMIFHCAVGSVASLVVMLLSGLIYVKRDARSVGSPISSKVFFELIMFLGCVTVFSAFAMSKYTLWGLLIAGVAYVIINIIVCRAKINVLSFLKWAGKYFATAAVFSLLLVATIKTGGFGYAGVRPEAKYLEGASFSIRLGNAYYSDDAMNGKTLCTDSLSAEQADEIMTICKKHIAKGCADVNAIELIFGSTDSAAVSTIRVSASSNTGYNFCPSPQFQFDYSVPSNRYYLNYSQRVAISRSEIKAMTEELEALDFVYREKSDNVVVTIPA